MTAKGVPTATVLAPAWGSFRARIRWTAETTSVRDGSGVETVFRNGVDIDTMALRRTPTKHGGTMWTLDLMRGDESRARFHSPPWDFDREHGPAQGAEVSGLPLVQRNPKLPDPPAPRDPTHGFRGEVVWSSAVLVAVLASVVCFLVPDLRANSWAGVVLAGLCLPFLINLRWSRPLHGERVFRPRPAGAVPRGFLRKGAVVLTGEAILVRDRSGTFAVPPVSDACGPRQLRPSRAGDSKVSPTDLLVLRSDLGHDLATFGRRDWCGDKSEIELAAALGVDYDAQAVERGLGGSLTSAAAYPTWSNRLSSLPLFPGAVAVATASGDASRAIDAVAIVSGVLVIALSFVWDVARLLHDHYLGKPVDISKGRG